MSGTSSRRTWPSAEPRIGLKPRGSAGGRLTAAATAAGTPLHRPMEVFDVESPFNTRTMPLRYAASICRRCRERDGELQRAARDVSPCKAQRASAATAAIASAPSSAACRRGRSNYPIRGATITRIRRTTEHVPRGGSCLRCYRPAVHGSADMWISAARRISLDCGVAG